jgi:hypothetical protein
MADDRTGTLDSEYAHELQWLELESKRFDLETKRLEPAAKRADIERARRDTILKWMTVCGTVLTFVYAQYMALRGGRELQEAAVRAAARESAKPFMAKRMELYQRAAADAAIIATIGAGNRPDAEADFWQLYWGELALVEDGAVESAMVRFGKALESPAHDASDLKRLALGIAHACRESLKVGLDLPELGALAPR